MGHGAKGPRKWNSVDVAQGDTFGPKEIGGGTNTTVRRILGRQASDGTSSTAGPPPSTRFFVVGDLVAAESNVYTAETDRTAIGCQVACKTPDPSSDVDLALVLNGDTVALVTLPAGSTEVYAGSFDVIAMRANVDQLQVNVIDPGTGAATKLTARVDWQ